MTTGGHMPGIPRAAMSAATEAAIRYAATHAGGGWNEEHMLSAAVEAAAPHIAAAERERIRQLAIHHDAVYKADPYDMDYLTFADLLTDPEGTNDDQPA